jgi:hypothetical protein
MQNNSEFLTLEEIIHVLRFINKTYGNWIDESDHENNSEIPNGFDNQVPKEFVKYAKDAKDYIANTDLHCRTLVCYESSIILRNANDPHILNIIEKYATTLENKEKYDKYSDNITTKNRRISYYDKPWKELLFITSEKDFIKWSHAYVENKLNQLIEFMSDTCYYNDFIRETEDENYRTELVEIDELYIILQDKKKYGSLDTLKNAYKNKSKWDENTSFKVSRCGALDCLMYILEKGCPIDKNNCLLVAIKYNRANIIGYINTLL